MTGTVIGVALVYLAGALVTGYIWGRILAREFDDAAPDFADALFVTFVGTLWPISLPFCIVASIIHVACFRRHDRSLR